MLVAVKAALRWGQPPVGFVTGTGATAWTERDSTVAVAYEIYLSELCPECGQPKSVCRTGVLGFEAKKEICAARAAVDEIRQDEKYKPDPGEILQPVPYDPKDDPAYADMMAFFRDDEE